MLWPRNRMKNPHESGGAACRWTPKGCNAKNTQTRRHSGHPVYVCLFITLNRYFYPSTSSAPVDSLCADSSSYRYTSSVATKPRHRCDFECSKQSRQLNHMPSYQSEKRVEKRIQFLEKNKYKKVSFPPGDVTDN